eukprot:CAMPEP_0194332054 /NCGR_PEP_ID=MMETSP0171-20130528/57819_1 /TAXON_ID=218684 /ORGANISM="Corethron pennatum, Strain L29A3" /LENGTH=156 /DNA_ID=CAMNT_0039093747 /DNA_START=384 /DNA_END=855 /DNA_ORIENTATION=-
MVGEVRPARGSTEVVHPGEANCGQRHQKFGAWYRDQGHGGGPRLGTRDGAEVQSTMPPTFSRRGSQGGGGGAPTEQTDTMPMHRQKEGRENVEFLPASIRGSLYLARCLLMEGTWWGNTDEIRRTINGRSKKARAIERAEAYRETDEPEVTPAWDE